MAIKREILKLAYFLIRQNWPIKKCGKFRNWPIKKCGIFNKI